MNLLAETKYKMDHSRRGPPCASTFYKHYGILCSELLQQHQTPRKLIDKASTCLAMLIEPNDWEYVKDYYQNQCHDADAADTPAFEERVDMIRHLLNIGKDIELTHPKVDRANDPE